MKQLPQISSELTKTQIKIVAQQCVEQMLEGNDPLLIAESISKMELFIKEIKSDERYINHVRTELHKHKDKFNTASGTKIEAAETGIKYDYSVCGDVVWEMANSEVTRHTDRRKAREEFLKTIPYEGMKIVDEVTGEVMHVNPPQKTSTSSYKVTISK